MPKVREIVSFAFGCALLLSGRMATAAVVYDSGGFEPTRFANGDLEGQDTGKWLKQSSSNGAGTVQTALVSAGTRAVQVNRTTKDTRWWVDAPATPTPAVPLVIVDWDMYVVQSSLELGPFFGMEAYDYPGVAGAFGVDAGTGELLFEQGGTGMLDITPADDVVSFNAWHHYRMVLNYTAQQYSMYLDNGAAPVHTSGFVDAVTGFTDADISALSVVTSPVGAGTAYFDNFVITTSAVPEPASLSVTGIVGLVLSGRSLGRRRTAA